jgi:predicted DNA-binding protein
MGRINLNLRISEEERQILDEYSEQVHTTQSDVVREFIRSLQKKLKKKRNVEE